MKPALLGREPALWLALVGSLVSLAGAYVFHLTTDQQGALNGLAAVVLGVLTAWVTRDGLSAAILGLAKAILYVALAWHLHVTAENQALILTAVGAIVAMFVRTQATPAAAVAAPTGPVGARPRP
jgi:intracellular septation protein A